MAKIYAKEAEQGHKNQATLAVARKLATFMLTVDKRGEYFKPKTNRNGKGLKTMKVGQVG